MKKPKGNIQYCAFLRGINVGGHAVIGMAEVKKAFEKMGLENVRTVLASGNVVFESEESDRSALAGRIESEMKGVFEQDIKVILRTLEDLERLRSEDPFRDVKVTPDIRLYVTFLSAPAGNRALSVPSGSAQSGFRILRRTPREVLSVVDLSRGKGTTGAMNILEREFGSNVTTRNWNTVLKILGPTAGVR